MKVKDYAADHIFSFLCLAVSGLLIFALLWLIETPMVFIFFVESIMTRPRQHRHLKRKDSIRFLVLLVFSGFFIFTG